MADEDVVYAQMLQVQRQWEEMQAQKVALSALPAQVAALQTEVADLKAEIKDLKAEVKDMKAEIKGMKAEVKDMKEKVKNMKAEVKDMKAEIKVHSKLLSPLIPGNILVRLLTKAGFMEVAREHMDVPSLMAFNELEKPTVPMAILKLLDSNGYENAVEAFLKGVGEPWTTVYSQASDLTLSIDRLLKVRNFGEHYAPPHHVAKTILAVQSIDNIYIDRARANRLPQ